MKEHTLAEYRYKKTELANIKKLCASNFTNRTLLMLSGLEEILDNPQYDNLWFYIDMANDLVIPELSKSPDKPSKALAAIAFGGPLRPQDYAPLVAASRTASKDELKEFLSTEIEHEPKDKIVNYLTFPILADMVSVLPSHEKAEVLLLAQDLIKKTLPDVRNKTFHDSLSDEDKQRLVSRSVYYTGKKTQLPAEGESILLGWSSHYSTVMGGGFVDLKTVEADARWDKIRKQRKVTPQKGYGLKIAQWKKAHHVR